MKLKRILHKVLSPLPHREGLGESLLFGILLLSVLPLAALAQNPVIRHIFSADPTARVFNDKVYVYPSHDIFPPEGQRQYWFCMADYHGFSS